MIPLSKYYPTGNPCMRYRVLSKIFWQLHSLAKWSLKNLFIIILVMYSFVSMIFLMTIENIVYSV